MQTIPRLFDTFSANLEMYREEHKGLFMCPLCQRTFTRDQMRRKELSKAHIIPQFLGGRDWTLTCTACNNRVGTEIESHEKDRANFSRAMSGDGGQTTRVKAWLRDGNGDVYGPLQADMGARKVDGGLRPQLGIKQKGSNQTAWQMYNDLQSGRARWANWSIDVQYIVTRNRKRANLVYVHAAYLAMFHQFGYEWTLDPCAEPIRRQILSPDEPIILPLFPRLADLDVPDDEMAILLVTEPADWRHFRVLMPLFYGLTIRQAVWMPLFGRPYGQPPQRKGVKLAVAPVPDHHRFLHSRDSLMQGIRFVFDHFDYEPVLYGGSDPFRRCG